MAAALAPSGDGGRRCARVRPAQVRSDSTLEPGPPRSPPRSRVDALAAEALPLVRGLRVFELPPKESVYRAVARIERQPGVPTPSRTSSTIPTRYRTTRSSASYGRSTTPVRRWPAIRVAAPPTRRARRTGREAATSRSHHRTSRSPGSAARRRRMVESRRSSTGTSIDAMARSSALDAVLRRQRSDRRPGCDGRRGGPGSLGDCGAEPGTTGSSAGPLSRSTGAAASRATHIGPTSST